MSAILRGRDGNRRDGIDEHPQQSNDQIQHSMGHCVSPDNTQIGVDGNGRDETTARKIASGYEQALGEASGRADSDCVVPQPLCVEEEGDALVHVGQEQVEDEDEELIRRLACLSDGGRAVIACPIRSNRLLIAFVAIGKYAIDP